MNQASIEPKQKSKILAFLIAVFLGPMGFHNFYLGRWKRGLTQFGVVFLTLGVGILITFPWAWIEAIGILTGKYSIGPNEGHHDPAVGTVSPFKEYLITSFMLCSLIIGSIFTFGIPLIFAIIFYFLVGGLWNKVSRLFIKTILPIYAAVFGSRKKFLIRFPEYRLPNVETRAELFKATRKLSYTAVLVLLFATSIFAQLNISVITEGELPNAVMCDDGTYVTRATLCDDGSSGIPCDSACVLENISAIDRISEAYMSVGTIATFMFAPFVTILVAPILILRYSSLSIVDKKTRSISPIGEKANGYTNVITGAGSVVLFLQTALSIVSAANDNGGFQQALQHTIYIFFMTLFLVVFFYPLVWLPMLKFTKSFESHVRLLDASLVKSKGIETHNLNYDGNELTISPAQNLPPNLKNDEITNVHEQYTSERENVSSATPPDVSVVAQNTDQHGYEWYTTVDGKSWYRIQGSIEEWIEFSN